MSAGSPPELPDFPRDEQGPVFSEPWEAKAFAMVLRLHEQGLFSWAEWAEAAERTPHGQPVELPASRTRSRRERRRHLGWIQRRPDPSPVLLPLQLISGPVVLVQLERDHIRLAVPSHRRQAQ